MEKIMTYDTLRNYAYSNDRLCQGQIRGIVISFFGLGGMAMFDEDQMGKALAEQNVLYLVPYNNPWAWMNRQAVSMTDEIMDTVKEMLDLPENLPIVSSGGSMGGLAAITYCVYTKRTPGPVWRINLYVICPDISMSGRICPEPCTVRSGTMKER